MTRPLIARLWGELPVYFYALVCGAVCLAIYAHFSRSFSPSEAWFSLEIFALTAMVMGFVDIVLQLARQRPAHPFAWARARYLSAGALRAAIGGAPAMTLCIVMIPLFSSFKAMIPLFSSYSWDPALIALDRALFLGNDAWAAFQPLLGYPLVTAALAVAYSAWGLLLYAGCLVVAFYGFVPDDVRRRFFLTYAMAWSLMGGVLATLFASVGPVFAKVLVGIDHFDPQMTYLREANARIPVVTLPVQELLLARFSVDDASLGSGISAMPSMHVAIATLFWLALRECGPRLGRVFGLYLILIWLGSFHLAYHYAVDGIVSVVMVAGLWWCAGRVFAAWDRLPVVPLQAFLRTKTVPAE